MKRWIILVCIMSGSIFVRAQTDIAGTIIDQHSGQGLEFASIALVHLPDSSVAKETTTDKKGRYAMKAVASGTYLIRCSFIGFNKMQTAPFTIKTGMSRYSLDPVALTSVSANLADVTVVGRRNLLNSSIDRKTYNVDQDIMSRAGSASDILKNIPSVEVDVEGNVVLRGSGDIIILINGKPSPLMGRTRGSVATAARQFN